MKNFKSLFPFKTEEEIPTNIKEKIDEVKFDNLPAGFYSASGFATIANNDRVIESDGRHLFKYVEQSRQVNAHAVEALYQERLQKASEDTIRDGQLCKSFTTKLSANRLNIHQSNQALFLSLLMRPPVWLMRRQYRKKMRRRLKKLRSALGTFPVLPLWFGERQREVQLHTSPSLKAGPTAAMRRLNTLSFLPLGKRSLQAQIPTKGII